MSAIRPLQSFSRLSKSIWLFQPSTNVANRSVDRTSKPSSLDTFRNPNLIILCTWMAASPRHIAKYANAYMSRYPEAEILLITNSQTDMVLRAYFSNSSRFDPAVQAIQSVVRPFEEPRILLHALSNGGATHASLLATAYRRKCGVSLPIQVMILDSAPGEASIKRSVGAFSTPLAKSPLLVQYLGILSLYLSVSFMFFCYWVTRAENVITWERRTLNDESLFSKKVPRCYIYSQADDMVWWRDVEAHAQEAERKGWRVITVKYLGSKHVSHMVEDEKRYWDAVEKVWKLDAK